MGCVKMYVPATQTDFWTWKKALWTQLKHFQISTYRKYHVYEEKHRKREGFYNFVHRHCRSIKLPAPRHEYALRKWIRPPRLRNFITRIVELSSRWMFHNNVFLQNQQDVFSTHTTFSIIILSSKYIFVIPT